MFNFIEAKFARDNFKKSIDDLSLVLGQRRLKDCRDYRGNDQEVATSLLHPVVALRWLHGHGLL